MKKSVFISALVFLLGFAVATVVASSNYTKGSASVSKELALDNSDKASGCVAAAADSSANKNCPKAPADKKCDEKKEAGCNKDKNEKPCEKKKE